MNDDPTPTSKRRDHGRGYLFLGVLIALSGIVIYVAQLNARVLITPWYAPVLATAGLLLVVVALIQSGSIWRYAAAGLLTLFAVGQWMMLFGPLSAPAYTGSAQAGQRFPEFETTLADGSVFSDQNLKGDRDTVMLFFRGRW